MSQQVTQLLAAAAEGDRQAAADLLPLVYDELRKLAAVRLTQERAGQTLQATALVHEAYLKLVGTNDDNHWQGRGHFFAAAAESMRRILVDQARRKKRLKHGGDRLRLTLDYAAIEAPRTRDDLLALDAALDKLKLVDGAAAELIQLRYFAGLSAASAAEVLNISTSTAERLWRYARAWLHHEIQASDETIS